ncbi:MAG: BolA family transcriptional regulator [Sphingomonadales bacterium CG12_big_fil_rev_8_21_14_0_65_65_10]|jgi:BolA family transcriptional regulator, general stress-responsive regulator|uniref:BolA family transcriptional regulator n=1 Tax=Blastomonas marina TaxID=1867408 RepID=A0ABQ1F6X0_9SPHN|nr:BolA family protein [Blastomonas marina]PIW56098.1 MAG: BolA family transcriptional regulator [Sphingomonadales bacterium CG12_big_fil_rev_8_21_14_0_65_65_10]GGA00931.1 BolA family transcriptional regulator [Blastomonas marina]
MTQTGPIERELRAMLERELAPERLEIANDSAKHHGHAGDDGSGESHFSILVESDRFEGLTRLERQRLVNRVLGDLPGQRIHALSVKALAPGESA